jgi:hypothetical protein
MLSRTYWVWNVSVVFNANSNTYQNVELEGKPDVFFETSPQDPTQRNVMVTSPDKIYGCANSQCLMTFLEESFTYEYDQ